MTNLEYHILMGKVQFLNLLMSKIKAFPVL